MNEHDNIERQLTDYFFGELDTVEEAVIRDHIASCPTCQQALETLSQTVHALQGEGSSQQASLQPLRDDQRQAIFAAADDERGMATDVADSDNPEPVPTQLTLIRTFGDVVLRNRWRLLNVAAVIVVAGAVLSLFLPSFSTSQKITRLSSVENQKPLRYEEAAGEARGDGGTRAQPRRADSPHEEPVAMPVPPAGQTSMAAPEEESLVAPGKKSVADKDGLGDRVIPEMKDRMSGATRTAAGKPANPFARRKARIQGGAAGQDVAAYRQIKGYYGPPSPDSEADEKTSDERQEGTSTGDNYAMVDTVSGAFKKEAKQPLVSPDADLLSTESGERSVPPSSIAQDRVDTKASNGPAISAHARPAADPASVRAKRARTSLAESELAMNAAEPVGREALIARESNADAVGKGDSLAATDDTGAMTSPVIAATMGNRVAFDLSEDLTELLQEKVIKNQLPVKSIAGGLGVELSASSEYLLDEAGRQLIVVNPADSEIRDVGRLTDNLQAQLEASRSRNVLRPPSMTDVRVNAVSTFSIDVDTASYTAARNEILNGSRPQPVTVRPEEFINYFDYKYRLPKRETFAVYANVCPSPFRKNRSILRVAIQGKRPGSDAIRPGAFTFVVDTSGSMADPDRLPMIQRQLPLLLDQMGPQDKITLISASVETRLLLDQIPATRKELIVGALDQLRARGATNLEEGLATAYKHATENYVAGAHNRVVLISDGVANLGELDADAIREKVNNAGERGITLTAIGVGRGLYNDQFLETLADKSDGNYLFVDGDAEARRVFVDQFAANFQIIARDVKIQVVFNSARVQRYRLIGYDNRRLTEEAFRDDQVDAGEVGAGQSVTALYEVELDDHSATPLCEVRLRYKDPDSGAVRERSQSCGGADQVTRFDEADWSLRLAAIVAEFAEHLRFGAGATGTTVDELLRPLAPIVRDYGSDPAIHELEQILLRLR